jgi:hypothetical protein
MGTYDFFHIDYPLPVEPWIPHSYKSYIYYAFAAEGFKSKSMECFLDSYFIDNNGYLYMEESSSFEEDSKNKKSRKIYFHGHIKVHGPVYLTEDESIDSNRMLWFEYDLKFTDSLLVKAKMISPKKEDLYELHRNI